MKTNWGFMLDLVMIIKFILQKLHLKGNWDWVGRFYRWTAPAQETDLESFTRREHRGSNTNRQTRGLGLRKGEHKEREKRKGLDKERRHTKGKRHDKKAKRRKPRGRSRGQGGQGRGRTQRGEITTGRPRGRPRGTLSGKVDIKGKLDKLKGVVGGDQKTQNSGRGSVRTPPFSSPY